MVSVSSKLVTLILFIATISLFAVFLSSIIVLKDFSELNPKPIPNASDTY
jgi:hypothetical protein